MNRKAEMNRLAAIEWSKAQRMAEGGAVFPKSAEGEWLADQISRAPGSLGEAWQNAKTNAAPMLRGIETGLVGQGLDMAKAGIGALGSAYGSGDAAPEVIAQEYRRRMSEAAAREAELKAQSPDAYAYGERLPERVADAAGIAGAAGHLRMPEIPGAAPRLAFARAGGEAPAIRATAETRPITKAGEPIEHRAVSDWDWPGMAKEHGLDWSKMPERERVSLRDRIAAGLKDELKQDKPKDRNRVWAEFNQAFQDASKSTEQKTDLGEQVLGAIGESGKRVYLNELRSRLPDVKREELDQALLKLMKDEKLALFPQDNPREITPDIQQGALDLSGVPQHIAYRTRELPKRHGMAAGGDVQRMSEGDPVFDPIPNEAGVPQVVAPNTAPSSGTYVDAQGQERPKVDLVDWFLTPGETPAPVQSAQGIRPGEGTLGLVDMSRVGGAPASTLGQVPSGAAPEANQSLQAQGEHPWTLPASQESLARGAAAAAQQHQAPVQAAAPATRGTLEDAFARGSETPGELAQREMEQAVEKKGQIQQANYLAQQAELQRQDAERQQAQRDFMAAQKDNERMHQEWAAKVPDQNRWWAAKSTGNKIGSAIAMIVGGFASGSVGQKNQALGVIEDSIAKDVQAQADQKNSMVNFYLNRGKDLKEAYALTASNLMLSAASRMEQLKASMGAQMVGPDTDLAIKGLRAQAAQLQQAATLKGAEFLKMKAETRKIDSETYKNYAEANKAKQTVLTPQIGSVYSQDDVNMLPADKRVTMVHVGSGKWMSANSAEEAKKAQEELEAGKALSSKLKEIERFMKKGTLVKGTADYAGANALSESIMTELRSTMGLGVLSESDKDMLRRMIPQPGSFFTLNSTNEGRLKQLRNSANSSIAKAYSRLGQSTPEAK